MEGQHKTGYNGGVWRCCTLQIVAGNDVKHTLILARFSSWILDGKRELNWCIIIGDYVNTSLRLTADRNSAIADLLLGFRV